MVVFKNCSFKYCYFDVYGECVVYVQNIELVKYVFRLCDQFFLQCGLQFCVYVFNIISICCYGMRDMCL